MHACIAGVERRKPTRKQEFTVIAPYQDREVLNRNVLASPGLVGRHIIGIKGASSAADAWEKGKAEAKTEWLLMTHPDVWYPEGCGDDLEWLIEDHTTYVPCDVVGFCGMSGNEKHGFVIDRGWRFDYPETEDASSIEEVALLMHRDVMLDPELGWHLWGTDIALSYLNVIERMPLFHNSTNQWKVPPEYAESAKVLLAKHKGPIETLNGKLR